MTAIRIFVSVTRTGAIRGHGVSSPHPTTDPGDGGDVLADREVLEGVRQRLPVSLERFFDAAFPFVFAVAALSGPGRIDIVDGQARFEAARSLIETGDSTVRDARVWFGVFPGRELDLDSPAQHEIHRVASFSLGHDGRPARCRLPAHYLGELGELSRGQFGEDRQLTQHHHGLD